MDVSLDEEDTNNEPLTDDVFATFLCTQQERQNTVSLSLQTSEGKNDEATLWAAVITGKGKEISERLIFDLANTALRILAGDGSRTLADLAAAPHALLCNMVLVSIVAFFPPSLLLPLLTALYQSKVKTTFGVTQESMSAKGKLCCVVRLDAFKEEKKWLSVCS